jgi:hypothetical protein
MRLYRIKHAQKIKIQSVWKHVIFIIVNMSIPLSCDRGVSQKLVLKSAQSLAFSCYSEDKISIYSSSDFSVILW